MFSLPYPLHTDCQFLFAFTWEDPDTHTSTQLTWTVLPQGFRDSPHFFGQDLARDLASCPLTNSKVLQYVDDLLICSPTKQDSLLDTATLLNHLGSLGYRVSKHKAQISRQTVTYLGIEITPTTRSLTTDRVALIRNLLPPQDAKEVQSFLGLIGFFRHWIPNFGILAKPLYTAVKETPHGPLSNPKLISTHFTRLKACLLSQPTLSLPDFQRPFQLFTDERQKVAVGLLAQPVGSTHHPVAYLSKQLDPTVQGWQPCLHALAVAACLTQEAKKLIRGSNLTVLSTHRLQDLISHKSISHLTPSRLQLFHLLFIEDPTVTLEVCSSLNPATLLPDPLKPPHTKHSCPEVLEAQPPSHLHLHDQPLQNAQLTLFVDGSSFINPQGNRQAGYAVVTSSTVLEAKPLPQGTTSQQAELTALTKALLLSKGKTVNIYTDSKYAFLIAHTHSVIWKERGFLTTCGTPIINKKQILKLLDALSAPSKVAIIHCRGHQTPSNPVTAGNSFADTTAKSAAGFSAPTLPSIYFLSPQYTPIYTQEEKAKLLQNPAAKLTSHDWIYIDNKLVIPETQLHTILTDIHNSLHIGPKALYNFLNPLLHCPALQKHLLTINQQCPICLKTNPQGALRNPHPSHQLRGHQPGEDWQIDFTHMPRHKKFKYLLILVDTFSGWIEAYPTTGETVNIVASILTEHIIPRFGLPLTLQSDNGPAVISKVVHQVAALLHITWKLHIPYRPQSSGKVEKANGLIKQQLTKLSLETRQSWVTLLPLALTRLRAAPRSLTGLSPCELVYGQPLTLQQLPTLSSPLATYLPYLTLLRQLLRQHAELAHPPPTDTYSPHLSLCPGDQVYLKNIQAKDLQPRWKGPYTVLLSTYTAAKLLGHTHWVHITQLKKAPTEDNQWASTRLTPTRLKFTKLSQPPHVP
uniref:Uncharacterized protein n=1 Tax=Piliocolobus tephrosceles TaxID=591936 RepID=A0A8C9IK47_9PRIM